MAQDLRRRKYALVAQGRSRQFALGVQAENEQARSAMGDENLVTANMAQGIGGARKTGLARSTSSRICLSLTPN